jgi:hypothetical protein
VYLRPADKLPARKPGGIPNRLHDVQLHQVQLDELFALVSEGEVGQVSEAAALERLKSASHWVWGAIDLVSKLLLALDIGVSGPVKPKPTVVEKSLI